MSFESAEGFVLAGGRSSRMGRDKALLEFGGVPLIEHALGKLRGVDLSPRIVGCRADLAKYAEVIEDLRPGCGPLGGIEAALTATKSELNLFIPVDLPLLPVAFLQWMLARAGLTGAMATVPMVCARAHPLCSVVRRELLATVSTAVTEGRFRVMDALRSGNCLDPTAGHSSNFVAGSFADLFDVEAIAPTRQDWPVEPPLQWWFQNLNRPEDLVSIDSANLGRSEMREQNQRSPKRGLQGKLR